MISVIDFSTKKKTWSYFFILGPADIRKTFLYSVFYHYYCVYEKFILYIRSFNIA